MHLGRFYVTRTATEKNNNDRKYYISDLTLNCQKENVYNLIKFVRKW